jgi:1,4-dihydroxy-2-naphthoate polyprenyltransferase
MTQSPWLNATRPKTLPASAVPILLANAFAYRSGVFSWWVFLVTLCCGIALQVLANFTNEIGDFKRGADGAERLGPERAVSKGVITLSAMRRVSILLSLGTFLLGLLLVWYAGWVVLAIGIVSLIFAWAYTSGPYPLAYKGLGDVFAMLFFGIVPVCGAYYVQTSAFSSNVFIASLAPGLFAMNILGVNNIRDIETDSAVGKKTVAVRIGRPNAITLYIALTVLAYLLPIILMLLTNNAWFLLCFVSIPNAIKLCRYVRTAQGKEYNSALARTGQLLVLYGVLMIIGVLVG